MFKEGIPSAMLIFKWPLVICFIFLTLKQFSFSEVIDKTDSVVEFNMDRCTKQDSIFIRKVATLLTNNLRIVIFLFVSTNNYFDI